MGKQIITVGDIARAIERFAPRSLQESYDNAGLQVGEPDMAVSAILICLDVTEEILNEAEHRHCNMIVSHHPLIFRGLKAITGANATQRIAMEAIRRNIAIYSAHTNLDSVRDGVSWEMANMLELSDTQVLSPRPDGSGLGVIGTVSPTPSLEFLRRVKDTFNVKALRYSAQSPQLVVRRVAMCGGSGASFIEDAINAGADIYITGDVKYHDFTSYALDILIADIGHFESERCSARIFSRIIADAFPDFPTFISESEQNPVKIL